MEQLESSRGLLETFEHLRKVLHYRREDLLSISLYTLIERVKSFLTLEPKIYFSELFLEFLSKLSYGLYIKSNLLLNLPPPIVEEEVTGKDYLRERAFFLYQALPLERLLNDKIFLPKVNGVTVPDRQEGKGDPSQLIKALLDLLEKVKQEPFLTLNLDTPSIEEYLERLKGFLEGHPVTTWEELIKVLNLTNLLEKVYLFLSLLFLVFEGICGVHQDEQEIIHIFIKL